MKSSADKFHYQLMSTISIAKEFLGIGYNEIMKLPLKDFYMLLKIRSNEEKRKQEYMKQQQANDSMKLKTNNKVFKYNKK